jgi:superfamily II RNA helicase
MIELCKEYDKYNININQYGIQLSTNVIKNNRKKMDDIRQTEGFQENYKKYREMKNIYEKYNELENKLGQSINYTINRINTILSLLYKNNYITKEKLPLTSVDVTKKGIIACAIQECNGILISELLSSNLLDNLNYMELAAILSLFTDTKPIDKNMEELEDENIPEGLYSIIDYIDKRSKEWEEEQIQNRLDINIDWSINRYIVGAVYRWMNEDNINDIIEYYNIYEGNFIKSMIKIYNIAGDLIEMGRIIDKNKISVESSKIVKNILRGIVNVESIYIR